MAILVKSETPVSDKNRWATTWQAFHDAQELYGRSFLLDVCAEPATTKVSRYIIAPERFDELPESELLVLENGWVEYQGKSITAIDALDSQWAMDWWCNPPFDHKVEFIQKAIQADLAGHHGMMMLPYEPLTGWWQTYVDGNAAKIYEPDGRYNFMEVDGITKKTGVNFGCAFVLFDCTKRTTPRERFKRGISDKG